MGLFDPLWMTDNDKKEAKAVQSVGRVSDVAELLRIAREAPLWRVKGAARARLADCMTQQDWPAVAALLCETRVLRVYGGDPDSGEEEVCKRLIDAIKDEALREQIAIRSEECVISEAAGASITDPAAILRVVFGARHVGAVYQILSQGKLKDRAALTKIVDRTFPFAFVESRSERQFQTVSRMRSELDDLAVDHTKDAELLADVMIKHRGEPIANDAGRRLERLCEKAAGAQRETVCRAMVRALGSDPDQNEMSGLFCTLEEYPSRALGEQLQQQLSPEGLARNPRIWKYLSLCSVPGAEQLVLLATDLSALSEAQIIRCAKTPEGVALLVRLAEECADKDGKGESADDGSRRIKLKAAAAALKAAYRAGATGLNAVKGKQLCPHYDVPGQGTCYPHGDVPAVVVKL